MYKALGVVLIFLSLGAFLFKTVETKKTHLLNLKEFKKALTLLKNELSFTMPEISHLVSTISQKTSGEISYIFNAISEILIKDSGIDFFTAWETAVGKRMLFSKEATDEIFAFCKNFGKKTVDIEIENIKQYEKILEGIINEENDKFIKDKKLIYTLGVSIGAVIVILGI